MRTKQNTVAFCLKYVIPFTILVFIIVHIVTMQYSGCRCHGFELQIPRLSGKGGFSTRPLGSRDHQFTDNLGWGLCFICHLLPPYGEREGCTAWKGGAGEEAPMGEEGGAVWKGVGGSLKAQMLQASWWKEYWLHRRRCCVDSPLARCQMLQVGGGRSVGCLGAEVA